MEYLCAQTGKVLQKASSDEDNETSLQVPDGDDEDEGFQVSKYYIPLKYTKEFYTTPYLIHKSDISSDKSENRKPKK